MGRRWTVVAAAGAVVATLAPAPLGTVAPAGAQAASPVTAVALHLLGHTDLASPGLDGAVRPRGNNGDVAVLRDTAYVGGGAVGHDASSSPGRICTDWGGVKVVDLSDPSAPAVRTTISMVDQTGIGAGPPGNPRRGQRVDNVAVSAAAVDVLTVSTPAFSGDLLAVAVTRCEPPFTAGGRVELYDVNEPRRPRRLGSYRATGPGGDWGVYEDVRLFTRGDRPYALVAIPFNGSDLRLVDLGDPTNPREVGAFPSGIDIDRDSVNGCTPSVAGRRAAPTPDGSRAVVSFGDGSTSFEPHPGAVVSVALDDLRVAANPPHIGYPPDPLVEGNAADAAPFVDRDGRAHALVSEDDVDPALTNLTVDGPGFTAFSGRVCEARVGHKVYELPGQRLQAPVVYVGPACPADPLAGATSLAADPLLADPRGAVVLVDTNAGCTAQERLEHLRALGAVGVVQANTFLDTVDAAPEGGYPAVPDVVAPTAAARAIQHAPNPHLASTAYPPAWARTVTSVQVTMAAGAPSEATLLVVRPITVALPPGTTLLFANGVSKVVQDFAPVGANTLTVLASPGSVALRSVASVTNVTVRPVAVVVSEASNTSPIVVTTPAHGLRSGDRVAVADVLGNAAANGTWTVTVESPTRFSLDGSAGSGGYAGGGYVTFCPPSNPDCEPGPTRTDRWRYQSLASAADRTARGSVGQASRFSVAGGRTYVAGATLEVQRLVGGVFRAAVVWFDGADAPMAESEVGALGGAGAPTRFTTQVVAPPGAVEAGLKFEWTGEAEGLAYASGLTLGPGGLVATLRDDRGEWGAQRMVDFGTDPPEEVAIYRSPTARAWPPPDDGIYAPRMTRMVGNDLAFAAWMSDGLRVLDVSEPDAPREVGSFVPPAVADPSPAAGAGPTNRRGESGSLQRGQSWPARPLVAAVDVVRRGERSGLAVVSDINGGLYVLSFAVAFDGYWSVASDGGVFAFGTSPFLGSMGGKRLSAPVVGLASTAGGGGYWLVAADGGVFTFGDATFHGSTGALRLARPVVGMAPTPAGKGYWLVAADGGVFAFGDARFFGSTGALRLNRPVVGIAASPTGRGYWTAASDGGVFAFGDAPFAGSTGGIRLNSPVVGVAGSSGGRGYRLVAADGGVFAFGDASFLGSTGFLRLVSPVVGLAARR